MARQSWLLHRNRPIIEIWLREPLTGFTSRRVVLADTGAGDRFFPVDLILSDADVKQFGTLQDLGQVGMGGAIQGQFSIHAVQIEIPGLSFLRRVNVVGVPAAMLFAGFDGFAQFSFLSRFTYGNGGNPAEFGLETS